MASGIWQDYLRHVKLLATMHREKANKHSTSEDSQALYWTGVARGLELAVEALDLTIAENDDDRTADIIRTRIEEAKRR